MFTALTVKLAVWYTGIVSLVILVIGFEAILQSEGSLEFEFILLGTGLGGLVLVSVGGFVVSNRSVAPIRTAVASQRSFTADASHEIRTPMAVIRANAEVLLSHLDEPVRSLEAELDAIVGEVEYVDRLLGRLLILAELDATEGQIQRERVDFGEVVAEVVEHHQALAARQQVHLVGSTGSVPMNGDRDKLRQIVQILIENGLRYTSPGGEVRVSAVSSGKRAVLTVGDTGTGIGTEDLDHVFERFYRADKARARDRGHFGLGLPIAKAIAEAHGGQISVQSVLGEGTTFVVEMEGIPTRDGTRLGRPNGDGVAAGRRGGR